MQSLLPSVGVEKESITGQARKVMPLLKATENETLNFMKKEELEENSIYNFKPIEDMKLRGHNSISALGI